MRILRITAWMALLGLGLGGCASAFWVDTEQPQSPAFKPYKHLYVGWFGLRESDWQTFGYPNQAEWAGQIRELNVDGLQKYVKEWIPAVQVSGPQAQETEPPAAGDLYIKFTFKGLQQRWNAFSATPDELSIDVEFIDVASKESVYKAAMVVTTLGRFGPRNWACNAFEGRLDNAMYNLAEWLKLRLGM